MWGNVNRDIFRENLSSFSSNAIPSGNPYQLIHPKCHFARIWNLTDVSSTLHVRRRYPISVLIHFFEPESKNDAGHHILIKSRIEIHGSRTNISIFDEAEAQSL